MTAEEIKAIEIRVDLSKQLFGAALTLMGFQSALLLFVLEKKEGQWYFYLAALLAFIFLILSIIFSGIGIDNEAAKLELKKIKNKAFDWQVLTVLLGIVLFVGSVGVSLFLPDKFEKKSNKSRCCEIEKISAASDTSANEKTRGLPLDTIKNLDELPINGKAVYKSRSGKKRIINHKPAPNDEKEETSFITPGNHKNYAEASFSLGFPDPRRDNANCDAVGCPDHCNFDGVKRKDAKTVISPGEKKTYKTVNDFLVKFADKHPDADMPAIINGSNGRVSLEDFNATITKAWLFCFAKETDEDYHLVIGNVKDIKDPDNRFMIVEISGLPKSGSSRSVLSKAQDDFFNIVGDPVCNSGYYWFDDGNDPVPITVSGSIYWDTEHWSKKKQTIGAHGPTELKDRLTTVWEFHPISNIQELKQ